MQHRLTSETPSSALYGSQTSGSSWSIQIYNRISAIVRALANVLHLFPHFAITTPYWIILARTLQLTGCSSYVLFTWLQLHLDIFLQVKNIIEGLRYLHEKDVIHGDLHCVRPDPSSVYFTPLIQSIPEQCASEWSRNRSVDWLRSC